MVADMSLQRRLPVVLVAIVPHPDGAARPQIQDCWSFQKELASLRLSKLRFQFQLGALSSMRRFELSEPGAALTRKLLPEQSSL
jgi:hypothetical protein